MSAASGHKRRMFSRTLQFSWKFRSLRVFDDYADDTGRHILKLAGGAMIEHFLFNCKQRTAARVKCREKACKPPN